MFETPFESQEQILRQMTSARCSSGTPLLSLRVMWWLVYLPWSNRVNWISWRKAAENLRCDCEGCCRITRFGWFATVHGFELAFYLVFSSFYNVWWSQIKPFPFYLITNSPFSIRFINKPSDIQATSKPHIFEQSTINTRKLYWN